MRVTLSRLRNERGVALAVAVFALVVIGALVAGSFFAARLEQQSGQNTVFAGQAAEAAEAGLSEAMTILPLATLEGMAVGDPPLDLGATAAGSGLSALRQVSRISASLFLVRAEGIRLDADGRALARRMVGALIHLAPATGGVTRLPERGWVQLY
jgi:hypothetical protein